MRTGILLVAGKGDTEKKKKAYAENGRRLGK